MNNFRIYLASIVIMLMTGCGVLNTFETSEAVHILKNKPFPQTVAEDIEILLEKPSKVYTVIGMLESRGMGFTNEARDLELAMKALKNEAASIGAHAVIVSSSTQAITSGTGTERRIEGLAIRY